MEIRASTTVRRRCFCSDLAPMVVILARRINCSTSASVRVECVISVVFLFAIVQSFGR